MDRERFDAITRLAWTSSSRRTALGLLVGAAFLGHNVDSVESRLLAKRKGKKKRTKGRKPNGAGPCYTGTNCLTGPGRDTTGCDFSGSIQFFEGDFQGSDLSGANLTGAQMAGAKLNGADLSGACLVGANLLKAELDGADLGGAIFCRTTMPDGSLNDSDCGGGTRCCPTPEPTCPGGVCGPDTCTFNVDGICGLFLPPCCPGFICTPSAGIVIFNCEVPCDSDQDCTAFATPYQCRSDFGACPLFPGSRCCRPPAEE